MTTEFQRHFGEHLEVVQASMEMLEGAADASAYAIVSALAGGNKILTFGNGGSAAEASHLAEELMGRFRKTRRPFPAISLSSDSGTVTCISNDFGYETVFERQLEALVQPGDVAIALTTSGKSENVSRGLSVARARGAVTIALTGSAGLSGTEADHVLSVPSTDSALIQEIHLVLIHIWCAAIDKAID